jgi:hypothetical protein
MPITANIVRPKGRLESGGSIRNQISVDVSLGFFGFFFRHINVRGANSRESEERRCHEPSILKSDCSDRILNAKKEGFRSTWGK